MSENVEAFKYMYKFKRNPFYLFDSINRYVDWSYVFNFIIHDYKMKCYNPIWIKHFPIKADRWEWWDLVR